MVGGSWRQSSYRTPEDIANFMGQFLSDEFLENIECCDVERAVLILVVARSVKLKAVKVAQPAMKLINFAAPNIITVAGDSSQRSHLLTLSTSL